MAFKDNYRPEEGDMCVREIREDRYEMSVYDRTKEDWRAPTFLSLAEFHKRVRTQQFLGTHNGWEYYRPQTSA